MVCSFLIQLLKILKISVLFPVAVYSLELMLLSFEMIIRIWPRPLGLLITKLKDLIIKRFLLFSGAATDDTTTGKDIPYIVMFNPM